MKGKAEKKPDPLRMTASDFDKMMRHALGVSPEPTKRKTAKKAKKKASKK
jgi:hypothetical protein